VDIHGLHKDSIRLAKASTRLSTSLKRFLKGRMKDFTKTIQRNFNGLIKLFKTLIQGLNRIATWLAPASTWLPLVPHDSNAFKGLYHGPAWPGCIGKAQ